MYPGPVCKPTPCVDSYSISLQIEILIPPHCSLSLSLSFSLCLLPVVTCGSPGNNSDTTHYPGSSDDGDDSSSRTRGLSVKSSLSDSGSELQRVPLDIAKDKSETPVQPHIIFPARVYQERGSRSFQQSWYSVFPWKFSGNS